MLKEFRLGFFDWINKFAHNATDATRLELKASVHVSFELIVVLFE